MSLKLAQYAIREISAMRSFPAPNQALYLEVEYLGARAAVIYLHERRAVLEKELMPVDDVTDLANALEKMGFKTSIE
jgi:hypothetical protein